MPELPEVETVVRSLAPRVEGRTIERLEYPWPRAAAGRPAEMSAAAAGRRILRLARQGKHILFELDRGWLDIHLRMTGKLLFEGARSAYVRARLVLNDAVLEFEDVRQFGLVLYREQRPPLGPDALDLEETEFIERTRARRSRIKPLLLNQSFLAGVGNIYCDEALFRSCIHPLAAAHRLSRPRLSRLYRALIDVLTEAIERGGSSISDYVDSEGRAGSFQDEHRVYGRAAEPCLVCETPIRRIVVGQRGTHFCPHCQRR